MSPDPVRDEAERLVAAAIAAVSAAARGMSGGAGRPSLATGGAECCICPVCRVIAAMREPSPELAERIATGAGDLAVGVTSLLRATTPSSTTPSSTTAAPPAKKMAKKVAKKAVKKAVKKAAPEQGGE